MKPILNLEETSLFLTSIAENYKNITKYPVCPKVDPSFLRDCLPQSIPEKPLPLPDIISETFEKIQSGAVQWQHPYFFGYFPSSMSHSTIIAEMFANAFQTRGTEWKSNPAQAEVEMVVLDWIVKIMGLPSKFLIENSGGGAICPSVTHGFFNAVTMAKYKKLKELGLDFSSPEKFKFVAYFPEPAFGWSVKALNLKEIKHQRNIPVYFNESLGNYEPNMEEFEAIVQKDVSEGLIPFFCAVTYGYTATCGFDPVDKIAALCAKYGMFLLADAAYACSFLLLEEFRHKFTGLDKLDCLIVNLAKNFMISEVSSIFYVNDKKLLTETFSFEDNQHKDNENGLLNYENWGPDCSRKWNSLKIYFLIKHLGVSGLQNYMRRYIELAIFLEELMKGDSRFLIVCKRELSVLVFIVRTPDGCDLSRNETQREFYKICVEDTKHGFFSFTQLGHEELLRVVFGNPNTTKENIEIFWKYLQLTCDQFYEKLGKK